MSQIMVTLLSVHITDSKDKTKSKNRVRLETEINKPRRRNRCSTISHIIFEDIFIN